jgi:hypothetical protein
MLPSWRGCAMAEEPAAVNGTVSIFVCLWKRMSKKLYNTLVIILASTAFGIFCCLFATVINTGIPNHTPTPVPDTPRPISQKQMPSQSSVNTSATSAYTSTPTAINAGTPTITPTAIRTGTAVTPFLLPTKIPTSTYAIVYFPPSDYSSNNDDYQSNPDPSDYGFGASAICRDGTLSYSSHRRGTCSHHGGVAQWLMNLPP